MDPYSTKTALHKLTEKKMKDRKDKESSESSSKKKKFAKALEGFKSGSESAPKTDLSGARQSSQSAAQEALARRRKNKVYS